jgi:3D (Asp-Asp-Asp) domain-containing protein
MQYFAWRSRSWALGWRTACTIVCVLAALSIVHAGTDGPSPIADGLSVHSHSRTLPVPDPSATVAAASAPVIGARIGEFRFTMYYVAVEKQPVLSGAPDVVSGSPDALSGSPDSLAATVPAATPAPAPVQTMTLYSKKGCKPIAVVERSFGKNLDLQGTGKLADGRIVNTAGRCRCPHSPCYAEVNDVWALGPVGPLTPFRSVAIDTRLVKLGTMLYLPELDGMRMPGKRPWGGYVHDGCVVAQDRGGGIRGRELDFFVGKKAYSQGLYRRTRLKKVTVFDGTGRCERVDGRVRKIPGAT